VAGEVGGGGVAGGWGGVGEGVLDEEGVAGADLGCEGGSFAIGLKPP
jgi:hypothetical protein